MQQQLPVQREKLSIVAKELESLRGFAAHDGASFPGACLRAVMSLPGNSTCADCGALNPSWASVSFGTLYCLHCGGRHRSYGVQTSKVRSLTMDAWNHEQVLAMLEGGNDQMRSFFERHQMGTRSSLFQQRYHTKAAKFYRTQLKLHVLKVAESGLYKGREVSRRQDCDGAHNEPNDCTTKRNNRGSIPARANASIQGHSETLSCPRKASLETIQHESSLRSLMAQQ